MCWPARAPSSQYLVSHNVKALVMACNTATAAAIHLLRAEHPGLALIGVEPALKPAVALSQTGRIGVMATRGTLCQRQVPGAAGVASRPGASSSLQPCDGLAHAIERSAETGDATETIALCARYTSAMGLFGTENGQIDTLVLGCTHYPFASEHLRALLGPGVQFIDNGEAIARQTRRLLQGARPCGHGARSGQPVHHRPAAHAAGGRAALAGPVGTGQLATILVAAAQYPPALEA